jgi:O-antigen/teichoic acid export membrane protein
LAAIAGISATGIYAACASVAAVTNPLTAGFRNVVNARVASAYEEGGISTMRREAARDALLIGIWLTLFWILILLTGESLLVLLYGASYAGHGDAMNALAASALAGGIGLPATSALTSVGQARAMFLISFVGDFATLVLAFTFVTEWGVQGAAYAVLAGSIVRSAFLWRRFMVLVPRSSQDALEA